MRLSFNLPESGDCSIVGDRESLLVVIEAARRDLNACSQALGASTEWRNLYAKLATDLATAAANVPRVNLMAKEPFGEAPRVCSHPDDPSPVSPMVDDAEEGFDLEDLLG